MDGRFARIGVGLDLWRTIALNYAKLPSSPVPGTTLTYEELLSVGEQ